MLFKLPLAYIGGVRVASIEKETAIVNITHKWLNQNPFKSMFWAVQGMAAEFSTGALMINKIQESGKPVSMLVTSNNATFTKKATGKIRFTCNDGKATDDVLAKAIATGEGQTLWMQAVGVNEEGVVVSTFNFQWSVKLKQ